MLKEELRKQNNEIKLLLLGTGESGKSTLAKQMKIIHLNGFTDEEKTATKVIIYHNVVTAMKALIVAANATSVPLLEENWAIAEQFQNEEYFSGPLPPTLATCVKKLWEDPNIKLLCERGGEFSVPDSAAYFFNDIDRLSPVNYMPTEQDVLRARSKTTGVKETQFTVDKTIFRMVDVGGQRSERRKWAKCFEGVTVVLFCVSLSEYDMYLAEDSSTNRMHESLLIFKDICNSQWFAKTPIIIFFNKRDIFEEKITRIDLNVCFPDYTGGKDYNSASKYIRQQFFAMNENPRKPLYSHFTCATDTNNISVVFNAVRDIVLRQGLMATGMVVL